MDNRSLILKSVRDGTSLTLSDFQTEYVGAESESFLVSVVSGSWLGEVRASSFMVENLGVFFRSLAASWRGWEGERHWGTLEGEFSLAATADQLGHIRIAFTITQPGIEFGLQMSGILELEAGMLESIAAQATNIWQRSAA
jgi:hypothetical protein